MTDFHYWQDKAIKAGKVMCMVCFEVKPSDQMEPVTTDPQHVWDVCKLCATMEKQRGGTF